MQSIFLTGTRKQFHRESLPLAETLHSVFVVREIKIKCTEDHSNRCRTFFVLKIVLKTSNLINFPTDIDTSSTGLENYVETELICRRKFAYLMNYARGIFWRINFENNECKEFFTSNFLQENLNYMLQLSYPGGLKFTVHDLYILYWTNIYVHEKWQRKIFPQNLHYFPYRVSQNVEHFAK